MLFSKLRDSKLRKILKKKELKNKSFKYVRINFLNKNKKKFFIPYDNTLLAKNGNKTRLVRRCVFNNRSRGLTKPYNISRIKLREFLQFGIIPGYKKSVW